MVGEISSMPKSFFRVIEFFLSNTGYFADFLKLLCGVIPQNYTKSVKFIVCQITMICIPRRICIVIHTI